jgi:F-box and WD-40 domain protein 7
MADEECAINSKNKIEETFYCHHNDEREEIVEIMFEEEVDEEIVTEIHHFDDDNTEVSTSQQIVELETPLESTSAHGIISSVVDSSVKPKRLSDEFSNDNEDEDESDENITPTSSKDIPQELDSADSSKTTESSSCISLCFNNNNNNNSNNNSKSSNKVFVQSNDDNEEDDDDAIERADFESEQKLLMRSSGDEDERLNDKPARSDVEPMPSASTVSAESSGSSSRSDLTSTPTSSRCNAANSSNKSTISQIRSSSAKQKLSDKYLLSSMTDYDNNVVNASVTSGGGESSKGSARVEESSGRVKINLFDDNQPSTSSARHRQHSHHQQEDAIEGFKIADDYMDSANHDLSDELDQEDTWADCEEGSDIEEICTCRNDSDDEYGASSSSSEDELPSRDVDLSSYQLDPISDDILDACDGTPKIQRKRKLTEQSSSSMLHVTSAESPITTTRKRFALDTVTSPHSSLLSPISAAITPKSAANLQRTPRLIPTKDNPPPELMDWLLTFQRWTNAERLVAVDKLIEQCEPTQVRHMMKVIEPQFQRDFISLLPKELALHVLSYLEPKDLLRAAQTCRSWRFLADDNLLWKEKCKVATIISDSHPDKPKRGRTGNMPKIASPWKAAYMRHHTIEMNWRTNQIRSPKTLNGHDDHVITCLQFSGNRIVSGSDDNTLKVWSAVTGKCLRTLVGHTGGVWSSQMSGNLIISGSTDRTLKIWDSETGVCKHTLYGHTSTVRCMHLHGNK